MEMGTGKTKVAIDWAGIGYYNYGYRKVLVIAPLSVLGVWPRQIREHGTTPARCFRLIGSTPDRVHLLKQILRSPATDKLTYILINYEGIWREDNEGNSIERLLVEFRADLIVFDESHRIKSATSKQSRAAHRISRTVGDRLILTGTPITKAPLDAFGQFRAIDETIFGSNWYSFKNKFGVWGGFGKFQLRGYRHLDLLIRQVRKNSYRVKKEDCLDLPEKVYLDVPVTLSPKATKIYRDMAEQMIVEIEDTHATATIVLAKLVRLAQITSGFVKDVEGEIREFDSSKLDTCMDLLDDVLEETPKVVIFCRFRHDIERLAGRLTDKSIEYRILSGSVPVLQRDSYIEQFHTKPHIKVFIAQTQAGSLGIDLTPASAAIFYSYDHRAADYWQAQDRLHRQGQTRKVTYYHLMVPRSVDQVILTDLKHKKNVANTILHNPRILLGED